MSMKRLATRASLKAIATLVTALALTSTAWATPTARSFVSSGGADTNTSTNCAVTTPCRTFAAALGVTSAGGEIIALDSAGYGEVTITNESISIIGAGVAAVQVASGTTGVTINAGAGNIVVLRNLHITGSGASTTTGIALNSGILVLQNSSVTALTTGLNVTNSHADVTWTDFIGNGTAILASGAGVDTGLNLTGQTVTTEVNIAYGNVLRNTTAFNMANPGSASGGGNKFSILVLLTGNSSVNVSTNVSGNGTVTTGSGTGCSGGNCQSVGEYSFSGNINFP